MRTRKSESKKKRPLRVTDLSPRDRVLHTASVLFYQHGIHCVGIDRIIAESGVAKMTFYRHFPSKARLVAEYLAQKEEDWRQLLARLAGDSSKPPLERLLAVFDGLELAIASPGFHGCPFIKALAEFGPERDEPKVRANITNHFDNDEKYLTQLLKQIRPEDSQCLLQPLMSLIAGTVVVAQATGRTDVARKNKEVARLLLSQ